MSFTINYAKQSQFPKSPNECKAIYNKGLQKKMTVSQSKRTNPIQTQTKPISDYPCVFELELEVKGPQRSYVTLLRQSLQDIASPFLTQISRDHMQLTPVEIAISTMIRNGLSNKEIAQLRCISPATVQRHRENIRRKLGLKNRKINLATYLQGSFAHEPSPSSEGLQAGTGRSQMRDEAIR